MDNPKILNLYSKAYLENKFKKYSVGHVRHSVSDYISVELNKFYLTFTELFPDKYILTYLENLHGMDINYRFRFNDINYFPNLKLAQEYYLKNNTKIGKFI